MRPFRSRLVCRALALALAGALGLTAAAPAGAQPLRPQSLRAVLGDADALDAALDAARESPPAGRLAAFADAYAAAADDGTTAEAVEQLLGADSMSGVLPVTIERAVAGPQTGSPAPTASAATLRAQAAAAARATTVAIGAESSVRPSRRASASARPRAP